jgi:hypothetical protein
MIVVIIKVEIIIAAIIITTVIITLIVINIGILIVIIVILIAIFIVIRIKNFLSSPFILRNKSVWKLLSSQLKADKIFITLLKMRHTASKLRYLLKLTLESLQAYLTPMVKDSIPNSCLLKKI